MMEPRSQWSVGSACWFGHFCDCRQLSIMQRAFVASCVLFLECRRYFELLLSKYTLYTQVKAARQSRVGTDSRFDFVLTNISTLKSRSCHVYWMALSRQHLQAHKISIMASFDKNCMGNSTDYSAAIAAKPSSCVMRPQS